MIEEPLDKPLPKMPDEIRKHLEQCGGITVTEFEDCSLALIHPGLGRRYHEEPNEITAAAISEGRKIADDPGVKGYESIDALKDALKS